MAQITIEKDKNENYTICIEKELFDSKVTEKIIVMHLDYIYKLELEKEKNKQIKQQNEEKEKKRAFLSDYYWAVIILLVGYLIFLYYKYLR
jgi:hypothetical protein